ncbi:hypothetical protein HDU81_003777 [Chytriomyces hyalinus]|nr:hypothetical protein HDU81_003777 [Chytriomyces hyalinus]
MNDLDSSAAFQTADADNPKSSSTSTREALQVNAVSGENSGRPKLARTSHPSTSTSRAVIKIHPTNSEFGQAVTFEDSGTYPGESEVMPEQVSDSAVEPAEIAHIPNSTNLAFTSRISVDSKPLSGGIESLKPDIERAAVPQRTVYRRNSRAELRATEQELNRECLRPLSFCVDTPDVLELRTPHI